MKKTLTSIATLILFTGIFAPLANALTAPDTSTTTSAPAATSTDSSAVSTQATTGSTQEVTQFTDVPQTHPNYVAIMFLKSQGILGGYADGTFKPDQQVNRAEALKILLVANKIQLPGTITQTSFSDYQATDWFAQYIEAAKTLGIVNGNPDGTFAPSRNVARAEFLKMLLILNGLKTEKWAGQQMFDDVPKDAWFAPYMNYAGQAGLVAKDDKNMLYPAQALTRADVAEILYLMIIIRSDKNTQFLIDQTEAQMAQIEVYIGANNINSAKRAAELSVDFSQQAYVNMPTNNVVLSAAKLAKAYDYLMSAFIAAVQKDYTSAATWAQQAIAKASDAWSVNNDIQPIAHHIKDRANEILAQISAASGGASSQQASSQATSS